MAAGVPLRDVLKLPVLRDARVVAGVHGLDRHVRHVNVMEVPDILPWVNPDELLLTTAYPLRDDPVGLAALVPALAAKGLAGLALKPARYIEAIPTEMLTAADDLAFPLIELPTDTSFNDVINSVLTVILNAQAVRLQRSAEIHDRFTAIVLGGGGLPQIADALAESIGRPVAILDAQDRLQTATAGADPAPADGGPSGGGTVVQPITVGGERFGTIVVNGADRLADDQTVALEYAATVAALRQVQARAVAEADRRFHAVCLEELVTGHVDRAVLHERAAAFKWDLSVPRAVMLAGIDELGGRPFAQLAGTSEEAAARRRLAEAARTALGRSAITWERSAEVAALVATEAAWRDGPHGPRDAGRARDGSRSAREAAERLRAEAGRVLPDAVLSIAIGRPSDDPLGLADSYTEARRALDVGRRARGPGQVSEFQALGVDRLLFALPEDELAEFDDLVLGRLAAYDERHRTDLVATLDAFLESRNAALAARRLFIHYNTMKNRLRLIEDILGQSLDDADATLALAIAMRIRRLPRG